MGDGFEGLRQGHTTHGCAIIEQRGEVEPNPLWHRVLSFVMVGREFYSISPLLRNAWWEEKRQELGRPSSVLAGRPGRPSRPQEGTPTPRRGSDQPTVLGDGRAVHRGKGLTGIRSLHRQYGPDQAGRGTNVNLLAGDSAEGPGATQTSVRQPL